MNRGLLLSLLLLVFVLVLVCASTLMVGDAVEKSEAPLLSLDPLTLPSPRTIDEIKGAFARERFLFSVSVPNDLVCDYEEALAALEGAVRSGEEGNYAVALAEAKTALEQIKRSALFSFGQILRMG